MIRRHKTMWKVPLLVLFGICACVAGLSDRVRSTRARREAINTSTQMGGFI